MYILTELHLIIKKWCSVDVVPMKCSNCIQNIQVGNAAVVSKKSNM